MIRRLRQMLGLSQPDFGDVLLPGLRLDLVELLRPWTHLRFKPRIACKVIDHAEHMIIDSEIIHAVAQDLQDA